MGRKNCVSITNTLTLRHVEGYDLDMCLYLGLSVREGNEDKVMIRKTINYNRS